MRKNVGLRDRVGITIRKQTWQRLQYLKYKHGFTTISDFIDYLMDKVYGNDGKEA